MAASFSHFRFTLGHKQNNWNGEQSCLHCLYGCFSLPFGGTESIYWNLCESVTRKVKANCTLTWNVN